MMLKWIAAMAFVWFQTNCTKEAEIASEMSEATKIVTQEVTYKAGGKTMVGYLAMPIQVEPGTPGVLVVHEWWGQNDYPRQRARMLAKLGYVAFAVDMYGQRQTAEHPKKAGEFANMVMKDAEHVAVPFEAALAEIRSVENVDPKKIAAIGYCFGGSVVLEMARQGAELAGVVSFHGGLITPSKAQVGQTKSAILVMNGANDSFVKAEDIETFKEEMSKAKINYRFINYPDAVHGFTNPAADENGKKFGIPLAYNKQADQKSWKEMKAFLIRIFK